MAVETIALAALAGALQAGQSMLESQRRKRAIEDLRNQIIQNRDISLSNLDKYKATSLRNYTTQLGLLQSSAARRAAATGGEYSITDIMPELERSAENTNAALLSYAKEGEQIIDTANKQLLQTTGEYANIPTTGESLYSALIKAGTSAYEYEKQSQINELKNKYNAKLMYQTLIGMYDNAKVEEMMRSIYGDSWKELLK